MPRKIAQTKQKHEMLPPTTPEGQEVRNISLAEKLAEKQLIEGTASAQVITHYLKLGTIKAQLELEQLEADIEVKKAKKEALESSKRLEELYSDAIKAMQQYSGVDNFDEDL